MTVMIIAVIVWLLLGAIAYCQQWMNFHVKQRGATNWWAIVFFFVGPFVLLFLAKWQGLL